MFIAVASCNSEKLFIVLNICEILNYRFLYTFLKYCHFLITLELDEAYLKILVLVSQTILDLIGAKFQ